MLEQAQLRDHFEQLLAAERQAVLAYATLLEQVDDPQLREQVQRLHHDKMRHSELTERMLELLD